MFFPAIEPPDLGVPRRPADHGACPRWFAAEAAADAGRGGAGRAAAEATVGAGRGGAGRDAAEAAVDARPGGAVWAAAVAAVRAGPRGVGGLQRRPPSLLLALPWNTRSMLSHSLLLVLSHTLADQGKK
jgi:hypothetical protein